MSTHTLLIIVLCGIGTFLLRFLPIRQARRTTGSSQASRRVQRLLQGIGPAAIMALLVISLWPSVAGTGPHAAKILCALAALATIGVLKNRLGGIALPTLAGALVYGLLAQASGL